MQEKGASGTHAAVRGWGGAEPPGLGQDGQGCWGLGSEQVAEGLPNTTFSEKCNRRGHETTRPTQSPEGRRQGPPRASKGSPQSWLQKSHSRLGVREEWGGRGGVSTPAGFPSGACRPALSWAGQVAPSPLLWPAEIAPDHPTSHILGAPRQGRRLFLPHPHLVPLPTQITSPFSTEAGRTSTRLPSEGFTSSPSLLLSPSCFTPYSQGPTYERPQPRGGPWVQPQTWS